MIEFDTSHIRQGFADNYCIFQNDCILTTIGYGIDTFGTGSGHGFFCMNSGWISYAEGHGYYDD